MSKNNSEQKRRILVVEDDPATLALLKRQLQRAGYAVNACTDGKEAIELLAETRIEIIVTDWYMPNMTGVELCRATRELREAYAAGSLFFILLTASTGKAKVLEAFEAGVDDFLRKPYDLQELLARIRAGERTLDLQGELLRRQHELSKSAANLAVLNDKLAKLVNTDTLTRLPNRRCVLERLSEVWDLTERHGQPLSCVMLDIDHFKKINDTHGHKIGDSVLVAVANTIRRLVRRYDVCGRIGGEEFLIVCREESAGGAAALAERIRAAIAQDPIIVEGIRIPVTISLGAAGIRPEHGNADALVAEADTMLYAAKENGRNQVWYSDSQGQGRRFEPSVGQGRPTAPAGQ